LGSGGGVYFKGEKWEIMGKGLAQEGKGESFSHPSETSISKEDLKSIIKRKEREKRGRILRHRKLI